MISLDVSLETGTPQRSSSMLRYIILLTVIAVLTSPLWLAVLALESSPRVVHSTALSIDDVENAKRLLRDNDPRALRDGEHREVVLSEREINLLLRYGLPAEAAARVGVAQGAITFAASVQVPSNPVGTHLNTEVILLQKGKLLEPLSITLGRLRLPGWMAAGFITLGDGALKTWLPEYEELLDTIESLHANEGAIAVTYSFNAELMAKVKDRGRELILPGKQRESVLAYYSTLAQLSDTIPGGSSLSVLLGPLFKQAEQRTRGGADPADEHSALILALAMATQRVNPYLRSESGLNLRLAKPLRVTLRGRRDLAQHFCVSAALAVGGGSALANAIGAFKELSDSQGGSGFSFPDLLADRAGVVFAEQATGTAARRLQAKLAVNAAESLYMPAIDQLPEGLQELEFRSRYEDLNTEAYQLVINEVEQRIEELALYR